MYGPKHALRKDAYAKALKALNAVWFIEHDCVKKKLSRCDTIPNAVQAQAAFSLPFFRPSLVSLHCGNSVLFANVMICPLLPP